MDFITGVALVLSLRLCNPITPQATTPESGAPTKVPLYRYTLTHTAARYMLETTPPQLACAKKPSLHFCNLLPGHDHDDITSAMQRDKPP